MTRNLILIHLLRLTVALAVIYGAHADILGLWTVIPAAFLALIQLVDTLCAF